MASKIYIFDLGGVISIPEDIHKTYLELNTKVDFEKFKKIWRDDQDVIDAHLGLIDYSKQKQTVIFNKIRNSLSKFKTNVFKNNMTDQEIVVSSQDINKDINNIFKNPNQKKYINKHIAVYNNIDQIISNAKQISSNVETKNRNEYGNWEYYVTNAMIDNKPFAVEFDTVYRNDSNTRHFRLKRLYEIEKNRASGGDYPLGTSSVLYSNNNTNMTESQSESFPTQYNMPQSVQNMNKILNPTEISNLTQENAVNYNV